MKVECFEHLEYFLCSWDDDGQHPIASGTIPHEDFGTHDMIIQ